MGPCFLLSFSLLSISREKCFRTDTRENRTKGLTLKWSQYHYVKIRSWILQGIIYLI